MIREGGSDCCQILLLKLRFLVTETLISQRAHNHDYTTKRTNHQKDHKDLYFYRSQSRISLRTHKDVLEGTREFLIFCVLRQRREKPHFMGASPTVQMVERVAFQKSHCLALEKPPPSLVLDGQEDFRESVARRKKESSRFHYRRKRECEKEKTERFQGQGRLSSNDATGRVTGSGPGP